MYISRPANEWSVTSKKPSLHSHDANVFSVNFIPKLPDFGISVNIMFVSSARSIMESQSCLQYSLLAASIQHLRVLVSGGDQSREREREREREAEKRRKGMMSCSAR